ncbi:hypothetical protein MRX96_034548 [Rhipicephalus microplus]
MDADEAGSAAPITKYRSQQRGPHIQPECSRSSPTEPEVAHENTTEEQNAVEQHKCGEHRGCDLSEDSAALKKRATTDATLPNERASDVKHEHCECSPPKGQWSEGQYICSVSIGVLVTCARQTAQKIRVLALSLGRSIIVLS